VTEPLIVRPGAERDIAEAFGWYETKKPGLGIEFVTAVEDAFSAIQQHPLAFAIVHHDVRRVLVKRFPYGIYYAIGEKGISVLACFHAKMASSWKRRLR
jgi:plasmid stabilization system protein ParE